MVSKGFRVEYVDQRTAIGIVKFLCLEEVTKERKKGIFQQQIYI